MTQRRPVRYAQWHEPSEAANQRRDPRWDMVFWILGAIALWGVAQACGFKFLNIGVFVGLVPVLKARRTDRQVLDMMDLPSDLPQFPCDFTVKTAWAPSQTDQGVVSFVDGLLIYNGLRTSFTLQPGDLLSHQAGAGCRIQLRDGLGNSYQLTFQPRNSYERDGVKATGLQAKFSASLKEWAMENAQPDFVSTIPVFPPTQEMVFRASKKLIQPFWVMGAVAILLIGIAAVFATSVLPWFASIAGLIVALMAIVQFTYFQRLKTIQPISDEEHAQLIQVFALGVTPPESAVEQTMSS